MKTPYTAPEQPAPQLASDYHISDIALRAHREQESKHAREFEQQQAQLLAQDKALSEQHTRMLAQNTVLTRQVARLTEDLHAALVASPAGSQGSEQVPSGPPEAEA